jgi:hypothetical protein
VGDATRELLVNRDAGIPDHSEPDFSSAKLALRHGTALGGSGVGEVARGFQGGAERPVDGGS